MDFIAFDKTNNVICINGIVDKFTAIKINNKWKFGYPEFDELIANFIEITNPQEIEKYSNESRRSLLN